MDRQHRQVRSAAIGWGLLLLIGGLLGLVVYIDQLDPRAEPTYPLVVLVPESPALQGGAPVWIAGREAGRIVRVDFDPPARDERVTLSVLIEVRERFAPMVRGDSEARVARARLLDLPGIEIRPGSAAAPVLQPGDTLWMREAVDLDVYVRRLERLAASADSLRLAAAALEPGLRRRAAAVTTLDRELEAARAEIDGLAAELREGAGIRRLRDPEVRSMLERVGETMTELRTLVGERRGRLELAVTEALAHVESVRRAIQEIEQLAGEPYGSLPRLLQDPAFQDALRGVAAQLDSLAAALAAEPNRLIF